MTYAHSTYVQELKNRLKLKLSNQGVGLTAFDIAIFTVQENTPEIPVADLDFTFVKAQEKVVIGGFGCQSRNYADADRTYKISFTETLEPSIAKADALGRNISRTHEFNFYTAGFNLC
jgi:hypothetical protein